MPNQKTCPICNVIHTKQGITCSLSCGSRYVWQIRRSKPVKQKPSKTCPTCNTIHSKRGPYCSRSCGNIRTYTPEQKLQKSLSHKNPTINITQAELKELFDYDPVNGGLLHRTECYNQYSIVYKNGESRVGKSAGWTTTGGYKSVNIPNHPGVLEHKAVYYWHTGEYPRMLDHIDGNKQNNRIENLRPATYAQNMANVKRRKRKDNLPSGIRKVLEGYNASFAYNGTTYDLGVYSTPEEAYNAYCENHYKIRGEFAVKLPTYTELME
jgi:hypothetical protein